jgi:nitroimidazol reductase NimA-like FMN-containing flavoprotein (pyridoxamine 5'-phosphate oxidase superfamily)
LPDSSGDPNKEKEKMITVRSWSEDMCKAEKYESPEIPQIYLDYFEKKIDPKFCRIATVDPQGRPFVAAFRFAYDRTHITVCSFSNRYTTRNIEKNPNVSVIVDRNDEHPTSYCTMRGVATIFREGQECERLIDLAKLTNPGLDKIRSRSERGEYNKGGKFLVIQIKVQELFSRMI